MTIGNIDYDENHRRGGGHEDGTSLTELDASGAGPPDCSFTDSPLGGPAMISGQKVKDIPAAPAGTEAAVARPQRAISPLRNPPSSMAFEKYRPWKEYSQGLPSDTLWSPATRSWPDKRPVRAPRWCSVDLRDGNQALERPMGVAAKLQMFDMLVQLGFREIEIGFPSASQTEFEFCRLVVERAASRHSTAEPWLMVLVPARAELIRKTIAAVKGAPRVIIHLYNSTSELQRRVVFQLPVDGIEKLAVDSATLIRDLAERELIPTGSCVRYQYSAESFTGTEVAVVLRIAESVANSFGATQEQPLILNLPETVQTSPPNFYADQIEWMHRHLAQRDRYIISLHPHNDRGCAVASAELALLAGAERVEGCLFGNGERTGNVCLVTLALNLLHLGIDPELDLRDLPAVIAVFERCTQMSVPPRQPWAGALVYTAFSGSHQDAIKKGLAALRRPDGAGLSFHWEVPYLPINPADVGRQYEAVVRINSQSGKGGVAFVLEHDYGITLPRGLQIEFSAVVQQICDSTGDELDSRSVLDLFRNTYIARRRPVELLAYRVASHHSKMPAGWCLAPSKGFHREILQPGPSWRSRYSPNCHHHRHHHHHHHHHHGTGPRQHNHGQHRRSRECSPRNDALNERASPPATPQGQSPPLLPLLGREDQGRGECVGDSATGAARNGLSPTSSPQPTVSAIAVALETATYARSGSHSFGGSPAETDSPAAAGHDDAAGSTDSCEAVGGDAQPGAQQEAEKLRGSHGSAGGPRNWSSADDPVASQLSRQLGMFQPFVAAAEPFSERDGDATFWPMCDDMSAYSSSSSSIDDVERVRIEALVRIRLISRNPDSAGYGAHTRAERPPRGIIPTKGSGNPPEVETLRISGSGNGPLSAFVTAVNSLKSHYQRTRTEAWVSHILPVEIIGYFEQSVTAGSTAEAICFVHIAQWILGCEEGGRCGNNCDGSPARHRDSPGPVRLTAWGVSQHPNTTTASVGAFCSALARMATLASSSNVEQSLSFGAALTGFAVSRSNRQAGAT